MQIPSPLRSLAVAAVLAVAACHHDNVTAPKIALGTSFTATVTGAVNRTINGEAFGSTTPLDATHDDYLVVLSDGPIVGSQGGILLEHIGSPSTGTYPAVNIDTTIVGTEFLGTFYSVSDARIYYSTGGTVTIDAISPERMLGRFDITMRTDDGLGTEQTVHAIGTFDGANTGIPTFSRVGTSTWRVGRALPQLTRLR